MFYLKEKERKSKSLYERQTIVATRKSAIEEAIGGQVGPKGEVAQRGRTYVKGENHSIHQQSSHTLESDLDVDICK